ncbi:hypothetical protein KTS45_14795 [Halomicroarcula limicola]|uniref:DUF7344 domain-containing protein n=1 Tax=Haloarcula limicola TaxID=1429915 RepID=A0A8J7YBK7_9EURY|nr:hypothetical protein [Halomicroarcula limicola]MBV0925473.1 hypothetical protein [Halomicroarcula limicola]
MAVTAEQTDDVSTQSETDTADDGDDAPTAISKDDLFHVLQNERRRRVLAYIIHNDGPFEMRTIAEQVAAWEHDTTVRQLMSDERQRVYIALYQSHLPKLDDIGLIEYNQSRGVVEATALLDSVSKYVDSPEVAARSDDTVSIDDADEPEAADVDDDAEDDADAPAGVSQHAAFMGVTTVSLLLTAGVWSQAIPSTLLSGLQTAVVVTALFALTSVASAWT